MLFNSLDFLLFYVAVAVSFRVLRGVGAWRPAKLFLLASSYLFYMSWNPPFVLLLLLTTAVDFAAGQRIHDATSPGAKRAWLLLSLLTNLGILGYFKYARFLFENLAWLRGYEGPTPAIFDVILPLGISFHTFQSISYTIDMYRGGGKPARDLLDFALFVCFFPQMAAGPIVRSWDFLPQCAAPVPRDERYHERALMLIMVGLFKKVVCADTLGEYVDEVYADIEKFGAANLILAAWAYSFQIYFDFSGYSDMAIGLAGLLGFSLPQNFRVPYCAENPREFWQRWHIALSTWLRDYVYISLGGNRGGEARARWNVFLTMAIGGLWHGAAWHYVLWGAYHGALLVVHRMVAARRPPSPGPLPRLARQFVTFNLVALGLVFFRAPDNAHIVAFLSGLVSGGELVTSGPFLRAILWTGGALAVHHFLDRQSVAPFFLARPPALQATAYAILAVLVFLFSPTSERFIYFQF